MLKYLLALLLMTGSAVAQTGSVKSAATLATEVNTFFLDNNTGQITPFNARQTLLDIIASYANINGGTSLTTPVVAGTSAAVRSLNVGSNFVAAQPYEFNINDNQAPAGNRFCFLGVNAINQTNGAFINGACGTDANPVNWNAASLSVFTATFGATGAGNAYNGEWHNYSLTSGIGGGLQSLLVYCTLGGTWTPSGAAGCVGANTYANTTVGGFTWGAVPAAAASGATAANIVSIEADTQYAAGAGGNKVGIQIVDQLNNATGTSTVAAVNTAFQIICVTSAYCWDTGILFPAAGATTGFGVRTTGTLIKSAAGTFAHGVDLSAGTCSTDCFKSNGFLVDPSGNVTAASGTIPTLNGTTTAAGLLRSTFGTPTIASGACGTGTNGSISGTNQSGIVTIGAAATATCTISFSATLAFAPGACVIFPGNAAAAATGTTVARVGTPSTTAWVITGSALASTVYSYICL